METAKGNPFYKPNPFKYGHYEKFHHAHLPTSSSVSAGLNHLVYSESRYH
jgi:hypothetical protein